MTEALTVGSRGKSPVQAAIHRLLANQVARGGLVIFALFVLMAVGSPAPPD